MLNRTRVDLSPTLTILGATLWANLNPNDLDILRWSMSDFKRIKGFAPARFTELHKTDLSWLNAQVGQMNGLVQWLYSRITHQRWELAIRSIQDDLQNLFSPRS